MVFYRIPGLIIRTAFFHDRPMVAHKAGINIHPAFPVQNKRQRLIPDHFVGLIKHRHFPLRRIPEKIPEKRSIRTVRQPVKEMIIHKIPIRKNHRLLHIPSNPLYRLCPAELAPGIAVHPHILRMILHKVILVLQLIITFPPVIPLQDRDVLAAALSQYTIHISAAAHILIPKRQDKFIRIPVPVIQQDLPRVIRRMIIIHHDFITEICLLHQDTVKELLQISLHIISDYGNTYRNFI